jgi:hypothetical protein
VDWIFATVARGHAALKKNRGGKVVVLDLERWHELGLKAGESRIYLTRNLQLEIMNI